MARSIDDRLGSLKRRRSGIDRLDRVAAASAQDVLAKSLVVESWEERQSNNKHTRYALGAMQAVDPDYTRISLETADRVGKHLKDKLSQSVTLKPQGSVPLDVHIRGVSDVDLLVLHGLHFSFDRTGCRGNSYNISDKTCVDALLELRRDSEAVLRGAYHSATVDCSGGKAICLSGGSLPRPVDIVPAEWDDNCQYQKSLQDYDRGVRIVDKNVPETIANLPFLHIKLINDRDTSVAGALKKAIRLVKNVKNDAEDEKGVKALSSFDVAGLVYHCETRNLVRSKFYELAVLAEMQRFFSWCHNHSVEAMTLHTPDGTRAVINSVEKMRAVSILSMELDTLAARVAEEQSGAVVAGDWEIVKRTLDEATIL